MNITVCIKQSANGEINPFDASAYEAALRLPGAQITLLSMGPQKTAPFLENLTRLGAKRAVLLCDKAFAGADTLATSYTLALALQTLAPDYVFCGRQSVDGDTGQVGPSLAVRLKLPLFTNLMQFEQSESGCLAKNRSGKTFSLPPKAVCTLEKNYRLRLPSIRSKTATVEILTAADLNANPLHCGLKGSPTRVLQTFENNADRRHCKFIQPQQLESVLKSALKNGSKTVTFTESSTKLKTVWCIGNAPLPFAKTVGENITVIEPSSPEIISEKISQENPQAVLWGSDPVSKALSAQVAALLNTGLCADCTKLETNGETLFMYRPACSGNIIAKIKCTTLPAMATVRTTEEAQSNLIFGLGYGVKDYIAQITAAANAAGAALAGTRKLIDHDYLPYELQVGLTGKTVAPSVYLALGISGAVHHIAGMRQAGTVIAVNPDKSAPIFNYADYGIVADAATLSIFNS